MGHKKSDKNQHFYQGLFENAKAVRKSIIKNVFKKLNRNKPQKDPQTLRLNIGTTF